MRKLLVFAVLIAVTGVIVGFGKNDICLNYEKFKEPELKDDNSEKDSNEFTYKTDIYNTDWNTLVRRYVELKPGIRETESGIYYIIDVQGNRDKINKNLLTSLLRKRNYDFTGDLRRTYTFYDGENKEDSKVSVAIKSYLIDSTNINRIPEWFPEAAQLIGEGGAGLFLIPFDPKTDRIIKQSAELDSLIETKWDIFHLEILSVKPDEIIASIPLCALEVEEFLIMHDPHFN